MKLNLACCDRHLAGYVNVDRVQPADMIVDLAGVWPWDDNSVEEIVANNAIEHFVDKIHTMNEAHRILVPGGKFDILVPTTDGRGAWCDPTHVSFWNRISFSYFCNDGTPYANHQPRSHRMNVAYGITADFSIESEEATRDAWEVSFLHIVLRAVK